MDKRIENIEFHWSEINQKHELVQWLNCDSEEGYCIVIAFFDLKSEGYEIRFIGDRPFNTGNKDLVWNMLKYGQSIVDAIFELNDMETI